MMGEDRNLVRRYCPDSVPVALGLHVIGDARARTNNLYAWGIGLAIWQALALVDAIAEHPRDDATQAEAFEARVSPELEARQALAVYRDRGRAWAHGGEGRYDEPAATFDAVDEHYEAALATVSDDEVGRRRDHRDGQLALMADIANDQALRARALELAAAGAGNSEDPVFAVDEDALAGTVAAAAAGIAGPRS